MCDHPARENDIITASELATHGLDLGWVMRLPVVTYHSPEGEPYWLRAELEPWLQGDGDGE